MIFSFSVPAPGRWLVRRKSCPLQSRHDSCISLVSWPEQALCSPLFHRPVKLLEPPFHQEMKIFLSQSSRHVLCSAHQHATRHPLLCQSSYKCPSNTQIPSSYASCHFVFPFFSLNFQQPHRFDWACFSDSHFICCSIKSIKFTSECSATSPTPSSLLFVIYRASEA